VGECTRNSVAWPLFLVTCLCFKWALDQEPRGLRNAKKSGPGITPEARLYGAWYIRTRYHHHGLLPFFFAFFNFFSVSA
jgi:hypothetical protein